MKTKKMKIEYRKQTDSETAPWQLLTNVDELLWNGVYALRVTDDDGSHNLPFRLANDDTVTFVVKDHAHDGMLENARTVVQTVTRVDRATGNVLVYNRTRYNAGGTHSWSYWTLAGEGTAAVEIPTASTTSAGAVIVGDGLAVDADGKVSLAAGSVGKQQLTAEVGAQIDSMAEKLQFSASFAVNDGIAMHVGALVENTTPYSGTNFRAYTGKILSNGELLVVNEGYLISTYKVFDGEQEIAFVNNLSLKHFSLDGEHLNYQLEFKKSDTTAFAYSELPTVIKYFQRNPIAWNAGSHINNYTATGVYNIHGNRENVADGLPFDNTGAFSARLAVIESGDCVAQQLYLLCADDKESATDVAVRTRNSAGVWSTWRSLDDVTTAQIHDGAVTAEKLSADIVAQINNNTEAIVAERTRAMGQEGLLNSAFEAEKQRAMQAEKELENKIDYKEAKFINGDTIVGLAREVYSRQGKTDTATFLKRTTAGGTSISDGVATLKQIGGNIVNNKIIDKPFASGSMNYVSGVVTNVICPGGVGSLSFTGYLTANNYEIPSHIYYVSAFVKAQGTGILNFSYTNSSGFGESAFTIEIPLNAKWEYVSCRYKSAASSSAYYRACSFGCPNADSDITAQIYSVLYVDLTEMYGAGNEPTKDECDRLFGAMDALPQGLSIANPKIFKSTGFNQFNPENVIENCDIVDEGFEDEVIGKHIAVVECIPCKVGVGENNGYCIHGVGVNIDHVYFSLFNPLAIKDYSLDLHIHRIDYDDSTNTFVPQCKGYLLIPTTNTNDLCVHLKWSADIDEYHYEPYYESQIELPLIPEMSEWGLAGISVKGTTVQDIIDLENNRYKKAVGCFDLGSKVGGVVGGIYHISIPDASVGILGVVPNLLCTKYKTVLRSNMETHGLNTISQNDNSRTITIYDTSCTTAEEYATKLKGVMLYYELATAEEYPLPKVTNNYTSSDYGVEQFDSVVPCNANNLYYMRSLAGETRNFLDRLMDGLRVSDVTVVADRIIAAIQSHDVVEETSSTE